MDSPSAGGTGAYDPVVSSQVALSPELLRIDREYGGRNAVLNKVISVEMD